MYKKKYRQEERIILYKKWYGLHVFQVRKRVSEMENKKKRGYKYIYKHNSKKIKSGTKKRRYRENEWAFNFGSGWGKRRLSVKKVCGTYESLIQRW